MRNDLLSLPAHIDPNWRIGIVSSPYYKEEIEALVASANAALLNAGIREEGITFHHAPGSFEIPLIGSALAASNKVDALIGLGIIVEGETQHARLIAESVAKGMMDVQVQHHVPFAFEVLYVDAIEYVRARLDKGQEAAHAVLHSLAELASLQS